MVKHKLRDEITTLQKWCKENNLSIFYGTPDKNNISEVLWDSEEDGDLARYLSIFKNTDIKILIINIVKNDIDSEDEEISNYQATLAEEEKEAFNDALKTIKKNRGQIVSFELVFFYNNVSYEFVEYANWSEDYYTILEAYDISEYENNLEDENKDKGKEARLTEEKIDEIAIQLTSNEKYIFAKNPNQRWEIIQGLLKQENITEYYNIYRVKAKSEAIYESEIKPKQETEIKKKILELKNQNLTKVAIASKLGISPGMVNKFYYTDEN